MRKCYLNSVTSHNYLIDLVGASFSINVKGTFIIRKRLRFEILRTTVISLRGDRGARKNMVDIDSLDLNLEPQG